SGTRLSGFAAASSAATSISISTRSSTRTAMSGRRSSESSEDLTAASASPSRPAARLSIASRYAAVAALRSLRPSAVARSGGGATSVSAWSAGALPPAGLPASSGKEGGSSGPRLLERAVTLGSPSAGGGARGGEGSTSAGSGTGI